MTLRHPRLAHAIMALRPGAKPLVDFVCVDHGNGPELESMINPPTQAEVDALTVAQLDAAQAAKLGTVADRLARIGLSIADIRTALAAKP